MKIVEWCKAEFSVSEAVDWIIKGYKLHQAVRRKKLLRDIKKNIKRYI